MPEDKAIHIIHNIISATTYLHKQHIVHRDIKADNVLLTKGQAKLADFGFAKVREN